MYSTSDNSASLEDSIVWRNSKSLITSSTHKANKHEIVFYERNGLSHGSFSLPFSPKEFKVNEILWNYDSTVLCVWLERISTLNNEIQSIGKIKKLKKILIKDKFYCFTKSSIMVGWKLSLVFEAFDQLQFGK